MASSKWRKVKLALGLNSCVHIPTPLDDSSSSLNNASARFSGAISSSGDISGYSQSTRSPSSSGLRSLKSPKVTTLQLPFNFFHIKFQFLSFFFLWGVSKIYPFASSSLLNLHSRFIDYYFVIFMFFNYPFGRLRKKLLLLTL
jgi:hypothetical protein